MVYNAVHFPNPDGDYPTVVARLIDAGASLSPLTCPSDHDAIDAIYAGLRQHGAFI